MTFFGGRMNKAKMIRIAGLLCGLGAVHGVSAADSAWYVGANFGFSKASIDAGRIGRELSAAGFAVGTVTVDDNHTGGKLFAGYQFHRNFAVEGGYVDLGRFTYVATTTAPGGVLEGKMRRQGANVDLVGTFPITSSLSALGRVGVVYTSVRDTLTGTGGVVVPYPNPGKSDTSAKFGLGIQYDLSKAVGLRGEVERYQISDTAGNVGNIDLYTAGLVVKF
jgi:OOP family OmpA-OmpF porin